MVFSKSGFTKPAEIVTRYTVPQRILLWNGEDIDVALDNQKMRRGLELKFHHAAEHGLPDYALKVGML